MKNTIQTDKAPAAVGIYSQGVEYNGVFYFSGMLGIDPKNGELRKSFGEQLEQILSNIDGLLESQKISRKQIVKTTIFMTDLTKFSQVNGAYEKYFEKPYPARSTIQVSALPKAAEIEIEVIAAK